MICWHGCNTAEEHAQALLKDKEHQLNCLARWMLDNLNNKEERRAYLAKATNRVRQVSGDNAAELYYNDMAARVLRIFKKRKGDHENTMHLSR